jgi:hypothetical protein
MGQLQPERPVVIVDIVKEMNVPVLFRDNSQVEDHHGNRRSNIYLQVVPSVVHGLLHPVQIPTGSVSNKKRCELVGILQVNAPVAGHPF